MTVAEYADELAAEDQKGDDKVRTAQRRLKEAEDEGLVTKDESGMYHLHHQSSAADERDDSF
jgi:hypothetical protein